MGSRVTIGYLVMTGIALGLAIFGCYKLIVESRKRPEQRDVTQMIVGICVAGGGALVMLITVIVLFLSKLNRSGI
jgi:multisubunit Na+/H+ antiporter MnhB subunit